MRLYTRPTYSSWLKNKRIAVRIGEILIDVVKNCIPHRGRLEYLLHIPVRLYTQCTTTAQRNRLGLSKRRKGRLSFSTRNSSMPSRKILSHQSRAGIKYFHTGLYFLPLCNKSTGHPNLT